MEQFINFYYRLLERYSEFTQMALTWDLKIKSHYGCSVCSTNPSGKYFSKAVIQYDAVCRFCLYG